MKELLGTEKMRQKKVLVAVQKPSRLDEAVGHKICYAPRMESALSFMMASNMTMGPGPPGHAAWCAWQPLIKLITCVESGHKFDTQLFNEADFMTTSEKYMPREPRKWPPTIKFLQLSVPPWTKLKRRTRSCKRPGKFTQYIWSSFRGAPNQARIRALVSQAIAMDATVS